jgi:hypothetical protein
MLLLMSALMSKRSLYVVADALNAEFPRTSLEPSALPRELLWVVPLLLLLLLLLLIPVSGL